ncbi:MAG: hypothetical protein QM503_05290, partial [Bacteroidota bacterium]
CDSGYTATRTSGTSSTPPVNNCQKNIKYNYYSYGCPSGFSPQNHGITWQYQKTDPNRNVWNQATLDDNVNSPTPPVNNCKKVLNTTAYQFTCGAGYKLFNPGMTSCPKGTSGVCNSTSTATSNCYKDIHYNYYSYGCHNLYSTKNYGLSSCKKRDPDKKRNNEATLNDNCNSPTPPVGNCSKLIGYKYYKYQCSTIPSAQGTTYKPIDSGITSSPSVKDSNQSTISVGNILQKHKGSWEQNGMCFSVHTNNTGYCVGPDQRGVAERGTTGCSSGQTKLKCWYNTVNNPISPSNNCRRVRYKCNDTKKPTLVGSRWMCSPFICSSGICALGICAQGSPKPGESAYTNSPFSALNTSSVCNDVNCDAFVYKKLGRCGSQSKCPQGFGIYSKNGKCYKDVCPAGATVKNLGNDQFSCQKKGCPTGYKTFSGKCVKQ